jgi:bifunctional DNA-binding transcriptional regulator/antitoxin component of YhaV-PrlF toxin-antitoxin module
MKTTIDPAGRLVLPKAMRDAVGLTAGPVELHVEGTRIIVEAVMHSGFEERDGLHIIPAQGTPVTDAEVRGLVDDGRP